MLSLMSVGYGTDYLYHGISENVEKGPSPSLCKITCYLLSAGASPTYSVSVQWHGAWFGLAWRI